MKEVTVSQEYLDEMVENTKKAARMVNDLEFLGIYPTVISDVIRRCEDIVKAAGFDTDDMNDEAKSRLDEGLKYDSPTNQIIEAYQYATAMFMERYLTSKKLSAEIETCEDGYCSSITMNGDEIKSGKDFMDAVKELRKEKRKDREID